MGMCGRRWWRMWGMCGRDGMGGGCFRCLSGRMGRMGRMGRGGKMSEWVVEGVGSGLVLGGGIWGMAKVIGVGLGLVLFWYCKGE